jgi:hypothetical protein
VQEKNRHSGPKAWGLQRRYGGVRASHTVLFLLLCHLVSLGSWAATFSGGTGEPNDPYRIATVEQLTSIGSDPVLLSKHFVLTADIDLDPNLAGGQVFVHALIAPVPQSPFVGTFDGAGHVVRGLSISTEERLGVGLFGYVAPQGRVTDLGVEDVRISGIGPGAGVVACNSGSLLRCRVTGHVTGYYAAGGVVADNSGTVTLCHAAVTVTGVGPIGVLAGINAGTITLCDSGGSVTGEADIAGGLVGQNDGEVTSCYATADVTGLGNVGGLVGSNGSFGSVVCCYSTGNASGELEVGGLVGGGWGIIASSYSTGKVSAWTELGGLAGQEGDVTNSYFLALSDGGGPDNGVGKALTAARMMQQASFAGFDFWGTKADGLGDEWFMPKDSAPILVWQTDRTGLWAIPDVEGLAPGDAEKALTQAGFALGSATQTDYSRPIPKGCVVRTYPPSYTAPGSAVDLVVSLGPDDYDWTSNPGDGTAGKPFEIQAARQLEDLTFHPELWGRHFVLSADIDMAGRAYSTALIAPDQDGSKEGFQGTRFTGVFDGRGFTIRNLHITSRTNDYLGLFGFVAQGAVVTRLNLEGVWIKGGTGSLEGCGSAATGSDYVGALAGYNAGTLTGCSASGRASGRDYLGQIAGDDAGVIRDCHGEAVRLPGHGPPPVIPGY